MKCSHCDLEFKTLAQMNFHVRKAHKAEDKGLSKREGSDDHKSGSLKVPGGMLKFNGILSTSESIPQRFKISQAILKINESAGRKRRIVETKEDSTPISTKVNKRSEDAANVSPQRIKRTSLEKEAKRLKNSSDVMSSSDVSRPASPVMPSLSPQLSPTPSPSSSTVSSTMGKGVSPVSEAEIRKHPTGELVCPVCRKSDFKNAHRYINHLEVHEGKRPFLCPECGMGYETDIKLLEHYTLKHTDKNDKEQPSAFTCLQCGKEYRTARGLGEHERKSHKIKSLVI